MMSELEIRILCAIGGAVVGGVIGFFLALLKLVEAMDHEQEMEETP
jgi:hypothetical protein